ncbi:hypothetical protein BJ944DRAFT_232196 [Cunninghamella echinulata]|nr:hypothetical protein BJ944DRAFT_232196 [Cunninghamella echinulata]
MIIVKQLKKNISIPLETFPIGLNGNKTSSPSISSALPPSSETNIKDANSITLSKRSDGDFINTVFPTNPNITKIDEILSIVTTTSPALTYQQRTLQCQAFIYNETIFLSSPFIGNHSGRSVNWRSGEFQACINHLIEMAESKANCNAMIVAIDKQDTNELNTILRAFMYLGFEMVNPSVYNHDSSYILVGYEF